MKALKFTAEGMNTSNPVWDEYYIDSFAFYDVSQNTKQTDKITGMISLYDMLEKILFSMGARIYQKNGCWYIDHIRQLQKGTVTYKRYNSAMEYQDSAAEGLKKTITPATGSPLLVPINHSLYKEYDKPYSKFELKANYRLSQNVLRYPHLREMYTQVGSFSYSFREKELLINTPTYVPDIHGLRYSLGYIDFNGLPEVIFNFSISGELMGWFRVKLMLVNDADGKTYYYTNYWESSEISIKESWSPYDHNEPGLHDLLMINYNSKTGSEAFSETVSVYKYGNLAGQLYIMFCPPYKATQQSQYPALVRIYFEGLSLNYLECQKEKSIINVEANVNKLRKSKDVDFYSNPYFTMLMRTLSGSVNESIQYYINPQLAYPGLYYRYDGTNHISIRNYKIASIGEWKTLERILIEDIMTFYSQIRFKVTGRLLGDDMNFGKVLDYDGKRYMICSMNFEPKSGQMDVTLLQISDIGRFLITESGDYVATEDGKLIII